MIALGGTLVGSTIRQIAERPPAETTRRLLDARMSSDESFQPPRRLSMGDLPSTRAERWAARNRLIEHGESAEPDARVEIARALLVLGAFDESIDRLKALCGAGGERTHLAVDDGVRLNCGLTLTAAYLARARATDRPVDRTFALANAASTARRWPAVQAARFNLALALENLYLVDQAETAWQEFLGLGPSDLWSAEARARLHRIRIDRLALENLRVRFKVSDALDASTMANFKEMAIGRSLAQRRWLPDWARATLAGDNDQAAQYLSSLRNFGASDAEMFEERLIADAVTAIDRSLIPSSDDRWCAEVLARAHLDYEHGRDAYDRQAMKAAFRALESARILFDRCSSPLAAAADVYAAAAIYHFANQDQARMRLESVAADGMLERYPSIAGIAHWILGNIHGRANRLNAALESNEESARHLRSCGAHEDLAALRALLAYELDAHGNTAGAWRPRLEAMSQLPLMIDSKRRHMVLTGAAVSANRLGLLRVALILRDQAVVEAHRWEGSAVLSEIYMRRSQAHAELGDINKAIADLEAARVYLPLIEDERMRLKADGEAQAAYARLILDEEPGHAIRLLDVAIGIHMRFGFEEDLPMRYVERSRARAAVGDRDGAIEDLGAGLGVLAKRRSRLESRNDRIRYLEQARSLLDSRIRLLIERGNLEQAFIDVEQLRATELKAALDRASAFTVPARSGEGVGILDLRIPASEILVVFSVLEDRLVVWTLQDRGLRTTLIPIKRSRLARMVDALRAALIAPRSGPDVISHLGRQLFAVTLAPVVARLESETTLVIVPDGILHRLPFATLFDPVSGMFMVEAHHMVVASSVTTYLSLLDHPRHGDRIASALVVGDPAFDEVSFPHMERLEMARLEASAVAKHYDHVSVLAGEDATLEHFRGCAGSFDVIQISAHTVNTLVDSDGGGLLFAPGVDAGDQGILYGGEITRSDLHDVRLVVLGACSALRGRLTQLEGNLSLAHAFVRVGVPAVIAPIWDVADVIDNVELISSLHAGLSSGMGPRAAFREAQLEAIRKWRETGMFPVWAGYQYLGI